MSNSQPTIEDINECIGNLNSSYADQSYKRDPSKDALIPFTLSSCGCVVTVYCLGQSIFNTEDDPRDYLEDSLGNTLLDDNCDLAKESLYQYLLQQYRDIVQELIHF